MADPQSGSQAGRAQFARGGPIFVPDLVGPLTSVREFKEAAGRELESLEAELVMVGDFDDDELSVEELKVLTEEELLEKALDESFEGSGKAEYPELLDAYNDSSNAGNHDKQELVEVKQQASRRNKRGRKFDRESRASELEDTHFSRIGQVAKVLQKQIEDKAAARLHSFNGSLIPVEGGGSESVVSKNAKMQALRFITTPLKIKSPVIKNVDLMMYPEVVLCVEVYTNRGKSPKAQEFLVLGSQTLTELRDQIYCLTDQLMQTAELHDPSGYFLIEDIFYNDLRDARSIDYSAPILDWLRDSKGEAEEKWEYIISGELREKQKEVLGNLATSELPKLKSSCMHKTRLCDLQFRLGAGYLYCHQGDCKHILVIRDMRLAHPEDDQNKASYPLCFPYKLRYHKCAVCDIYKATKVTVDDKWAGKNPCYFCDNCYYLLHYNEDGSLIYNDFTVYDYHHE